MDSLLASYASSDEEEQEDSKQQQQQPQLNQNQNQSTSRKSTAGGAFSSSLPPPKSSSSPQSLFSKIPPPKSQTLEPENPKSLFSLLPQPKTLKSDNPQISLEPKPKKVVQLLRPPVNPSVFNSKDDDEDSDEEKPKMKTVGFETPTVKSSLSSILPAPRNSGSLGALPSAAGTGRRSVLEKDVRPAVSSAVKIVKESREDNVGYGGLSNSAVGAETSYLGLGGGNLVNHDSYGGAEAWNLGSGSNNFVNYDHYGGGGGDGDTSSYGPVREDYANYQSHSDYGNYGQGQYESRWIDRSGGEVSAPEVEGVGAHISSSAVENVIRIGKRGRNDVPVEVVEVKQDELMKNRPREDKAKATGIAFGPTYQPVSTKGKPTKLHKRKHQIDSLYFDMRQKEMELAERRSKGFLTKAETQAKYGW